jgi:hypothetical protein
MLSWESLFIPSRLSTRRSKKSSTGVNPQGRSTEKVKLMLNGSHLDPQAMRPQHHRGDDDLEQQKHCFKRNTKPPYLVRQISKWFYDTSTGTATRAACCGSLLERAWLAQDVSYEGTWWIRGFTWFGPSECNTLRPWENRSCIAVCCSSVGLALKGLADSSVCVAF